LGKSSVTVPIQRRSYSVSQCCVRNLVADVGS